MSIEYNKGLVPLAKELRKKQTFEEHLLWKNFLSKYKVRFQRQKVIGNFIADFYCHKARLVLELDGSQHCEPTDIEYDRRRTAFLEEKGLHVLRISNLDVMREFRGVCEMIHMAVQNRLSL